MNPTAKDPGGPRRRSRVHSNDSVGARSPTLSQVSAITGTSSSSGGSMSTILQESCIKPRQSKEAKKRSRRSSETDMKLDDGPVQIAEGTDGVDVFEFLVAGGKLETTKPEMAMVPVRNTTSYKPEKPIQPEDTELEGYYRSQLSDSGISIGGSMCDSHTDSFVKHPLPTLIEEAANYPPYTPPIVDPYYPEPHVWGPYPSTVYTPEPTPLSPASIRSYAFPQEYPYHGTPDPPSTGESSVTCLESTPLIFRDKHNNRTAPPQVFRSFNKVTTRMLLQMQTNISDLEHELALLDGKAGSPEHVTKTKKGEPKHSSRHQGKDQLRRANIYQDLHSSLEQYYSSLLTFHQIKQITSPSDLQDRLTFKAWLQNNVTPNSKIYPLLGDGSELVQLGCSSKHISSALSDQDLKIMAFSVLTNVFFPLIFFKLMTSTISRLLILSLATTASVLILDRRRASTKLELNSLHWHCILGCAGVSVIAALFF